MAGYPALDELFAPAKAIEAHLDGLSHWADAPASLRDAVRYALLGGGKRLRPVLAWWSAVAAGGAGESSLTAGAAVEMIHAFSLVHDDLPAIDNDDLRRGRPTLHRHAGEAMAILAGDAMLARAFDVISRGPLDRPAGSPPRTPDADAALRLALHRELSAATLAMIDGQVCDTLGGAPEPLAAPQRLVHIHSRKTGALIRASCRMGVWCALGPGAGASGAMQAVGAYADAVGLMFQVVDDLIDATQAPEQAGKRTGKDAAAGKLTYPGVWGVEGSRAEVARLAAEADRALSGLGEPAAGLRGLCGYLSERTA